MTAQQLAILNSMVTYAAETVPGGLSKDEREVAQIVGQWALTGTIETDLREAARRVLSADMSGKRDIEALNALEDAAGFRQQGDEMRKRQE